MKKGCCKGGKKGGKFATKATATRGAGSKPVTANSYFKNAGEGRYKGK